MILTILKVIRMRIMFLLYNYLNYLSRNYILTIVVYFSMAKLL